MTRARRTRRLTMPWLLGLALIVRALVPAGWMPAAAADGGIALVPCAGVVPAPAPAAEPPAHGGHHAQAAPQPDRHDGGDQHQQDGGKTQQLCAFSGLALAWTSAAPPPLLAPVPADPSAAAPRQLSIAGRGLAAPPPPATGPPSA